MLGLGTCERSREGVSNDWLTPPALIKALGPFDLDPCASVGQPWPTAETMWTVADDGLTCDWFGAVWMNPPYGPHIGKWLDKLARHGNGLALIFARTETAAFHAAVWDRATALYFFRGRVQFHRPITGERQGNAAAPSVLVAYGDSAVARLRREELAAVHPGRLVII